MARRALWADTIVSLSTAAAGQDVVSLMGGLAPVDTAGLTVVRTILSVTLVAPSSVSDGVMQVSVGVGVVAQEAFIAGVVPDPDVVLDRPARGWLYRDLRVVVGAASMAPYDPVHIMADVRGARKIDNGELVFIVDVTDVDGTTFSVRTLGLIRCVFLHP